jgi:hypothetical protein
MFSGAVYRECTAMTGTARVVQAPSRLRGSLGAAVIAVRRFLTAFEPREVPKNMPIQALISIKRDRSRAERHRKGAARIISEMRQGATLHQHFTNAGSVWTLSDGNKVNSDVAKNVTGNLNVVGMGACLFPRATAA